MADSRTITINLKAVSDFNDVVSNAKEIQKALSGISLPKNLEGQFKTFFDNIAKNGQKATEMMTNGFKTKGDLSSFEKITNQLIGDWQKIAQLMGGIDASKMNFEVIDTKRFKELSDIIVKLNNDIKTLRTDKLTALQAQLQTKPSGASAWNEFITAMQTGEGDVNKLEKALVRLQEQYKKAGEDGRVAADPEKWSKYAQGIETCKEVLNVFKNTSGEVADKQKELNNAQKEYNDLQQQANTTGASWLKDRLNDVSNMVKAQEKLNAESTKVAQNQQHVNSELDHFKNRVTYFFGAANAVNLFKRALRSVFETVKDLDKVMTETAVVTKFSVGQMWGQLPEYTKRANELGVTIHSAYEAATLYYQQGLNTNQVMEVSNQTLKMARIAGLDAAEATDRMTNALRGFNMEINEASAEKVADVYSKLAAMSASNVDEISTAMTKVASLASNAKMDFETTSAFLAQIIETTRESAETAGTALKTVIARFSEVKKLYSEGELFGSDEEGEEIDVNKVSKALRTAGVNLNEYLAGTKGLDDIFIELASKWDGLDQVQQRYIATMAAGSRQQSRFIALMQDYKRTQELVTAAQSAGGASQEQYEKTLESMETIINRLRNAWNEFTMGIADNKLIKGTVNLLTDFIQVINKLTSSMPGVLGGISKLVLAFGAFKLGRNVFSNGLAEAGKVFRGEATAIGEGGAKNLVKGFTGGIKTYGKNMGNISNLFKPMEQQLDQFAASYSKRLTSVLLDKGGMTGQNLDNISKVLDTFDSSGIDAAVQAAQNLGYALTEADIAAIKAEETMRAFGQNMATISSTMMTAGGMFLILSRILDGVGKSKAAKTLASIGTALMLVAVTINTVKSAVKMLGIETVVAGMASKLAWNWVGAIVAVLAVLIALTISAARAEETVAKKAEHLEEATKEAAKAAEDAAQKYADLNQALDELKDKDDALDNLIVGTKAWRDAVMEVNKQVLALINLYPKLVGAVTSENGILTVDYDKAEQIIEDYNQFVIKAQKAALYSDAVRGEASNEVRRQDFLNSSNTRFTVGSVSSTEDLKKNFFDPLDTLARAIAGDLESKKATGLDNVVEGKPEFDKAVSDYLSQHNIIMDVTSENIDALRNLGLSYLEIDTQMNSIIPSMIDAQIANEDYANQVESFLSSGFLNDQIKAYAEKGYSSLGADKEKYRDYFEDRFGTDISIDRKGNISQNGKEVLDNKNAMLQFAAAQSNTIVDPIVKAFTSEISNSKNDFAQIIASFYENGKGGNFTKDQLEKITSAEELLKSAGISENSPIYDQILADLTEGMQYAESSFEVMEQRAEELHTTTYKIKDFSAPSLDTFFDNLKEIEQESGINAGHAIMGQFYKVVDGMDSSEIQKVGDALAKINWNDIDSIYDLPSILEQLGLEGAYSEEELNKLMQKIIEFANASKTMTTEMATNILKGSSSVISDLRSGKADRVFTPEEHKALMSIPGLEEKIGDQFTLDSDGNFVYLGDSMVDLQAAVEENTLALLGTTTDELEGKIAGADAFEQVLNWNNKSVDDIGSMDMDESRRLLQILLQNNRDSVDNFGIEGLGSGTKVNNLTDEQVTNFLNALAENLSNREMYQKQTDEAYGAANLSADQLSMMGAGDNQVRQAVLTEAQDYGLDPEEIIASSNAIREQNEALAEQQQITDRIALDNARLSASVKDLQSNWDTWKKGLGSEDTNEYSTTIQALQRNMRGLLGISRDLSPEFLANAHNMELMERAANDDLDAIEELRTAAAKDIIAHIGVETDEESVNEINSYLDELVAQDYPINTYLNDNDLINGLYDAAVAAGATVDDIQNMFDSIGWEPQFDTETYTLSDSDIRNGYVDVVDDPIKGTTRRIPIQSGMAAGATIEIPKIRGKGGSTVSATYRGKASATTSPSARTAPKGGGGGGGGGGKEEKPTYWKNPYDELYNLTEKINEALRTREALERRYQKIAKLGVTTAGEMRKAFSDQIDQLKREIELQKQLQAGRLKQLKNVGNEIYTDKEGNRSTFSQLGVTRYANYNEKTGLIQIDWNAIEAVSRDPNRSEEGEAIEAYISKLEELVEGYEEIRDTIWDMEDEIEELVQQSIDDYLDFESRVYDAMVAAREKEIEAYGALSDAIQDSTSRVLNKMQEQIESERQARENDKTEEEIADREARLAYLSRDTSGANQLEIMKLQQELDDARQSYTDSLIDQAIQEMQKDADKAAEQREQQQALLEAQLKFDEEQGIIMAQVEEILRNSFSDDQAIAMNDEELKKLLQDNEAFKNMSSIGKEEWLRGFIESWNKAQSGYKADEEKKKAEAAAAAAQSTTSSTPTTTTPKQPAASTPKYPLPLSDDTAKGIATSICFVSGGGGWGNWPDRENRLVAKFGNGAYWKVQQYVEQIVAAGWSNLWGKDGRKYTYASFKTGGLADFTGPAWLDGSRSHPEMVLNAADTENLIMLKDILNSILKRTSNAFGTAASELNFDIDINADLSSDYDVEQLADKVKGIIYDEAMYKNVNTVNRLR